MNNNNLGAQFVNLTIDRVHIVKHTLLLFKSRCLILKNIFILLSSFLGLATKYSPVFYYISFEK